jgi:hypothetical protein
MSRNDKEAREIIEAEDRLRHMQDLSRLIDAHASAVHKEMEPWKERRKLNHFTQEYEDLFRGNRR